MAWRESTRAVGSWVWVSATFQAIAVSLASPGRMVSSPGVARSMASCSMGWWVGPSSPTPIESWVNTNTTGSSMIAARRTGGRM